jgi:hypothetical protein
MAKETVQEGPVPGSPEYYQQLLTGLSQKGDGAMYYLKEGRNKIRFTPDMGKLKIFYIEVQRSWQGGPMKTKYLTKAVVQVEGQPAEERGLLLTKTVIKDIVNLLAEGYDLFSATEGLGVTISKSGTGLETNYSVVATPKPVALPSDYKRLDMTLQELEEHLQKREAERALTAAVGKGETAEGEGSW